MAIEQIRSLATAAAPAAASPGRPATEAKAPRAPELSLRFSTDEETGKTVIAVVDPETQEIVLQVPPEEMLAIAQAIGRMQGLLLDREA